MNRQTGSSLKIFPENTLSTVQRTSGLCPVSLLFTGFFKTQLSFGICQVLLSIDLLSLFLLTSPPCCTCCSFYTYRPVEKAQLKRSIGGLAGPTLAFAAVLAADLLRSQAVPVVLLQ